MLRRIRVRAHEREERVGVVRAGGPDLLPVDHEVVTVARRARLQRSEVRPRAGLRVALGVDDVPVQDRGQPLLLLLLGAVHNERGAEQAHTRAAHARRPGARQLLVEDELLHRREAAAAVFLRPLRREPSALCQCRGPLLRRVLALRVVRLSIGRPVAAAAFLDVLALRDALVVLGEPPLHDLAHLRAERCLFWRVCPVHMSPLTSGSLARRL